MRFKRIPLFMLVALLIVILDVTVFNRLSIFFVAFDPVLLFTITYSFSYGPLSGAAAGMVCGLLLDAAVARFVGPWLFLLVVVGYLAHSLFERAKRRGHFPTWLLVFGICFLALLVKNLLELLIYRINPELEMLVGIAGSSLLISIFTPLGMWVSKLIGSIIRRPDIQGDAKPRWVVAK